MSIETAKKFVLPTKVREAKEVDPHDLIIISTPKAGKTEISAALTRQLEKQGRHGLLFCVDRGGTDYVDANYVNIWEHPEDHDKPARERRLLSIDEAKDVYMGWRNALMENRGQYEYLVIDNISHLYTLAEVMGTYYYMYAVPMGKKFNRDKETQEEIPFSSPDFRLVTTLPDGNGYQYVYKWFMDQMAIFAQIAPYRIYLAHVRDTVLKKSNLQEEVKMSELSLIGKLKDMVSKDVSSMCKMLVDGPKRYLSFDVDDSIVIAGSRVPRLEGKILISEKKGEKIETYWENIYENLKVKK